MRSWPTSTRFASKRACSRISADVVVGASGGAIGSEEDMSTSQAGRPVMPLAASCEVPVRSVLDVEDGGQSGGIELAPDHLRGATDVEMQAPAVGETERP